ncbi:DNA/RNA nuclease SfsA [Candidatus Arthromitus sp. SFB-turkey]|uniref:DNA/RNA nuclease SfsA n=1 Tax=Candidatus Arthromitus sp. SFB-turkey TaxID=1840217 RepID=UPI0007F36738|nr:DNA/RNA nuclease SfsA [Candidatus Arthromitus sp. SFB-turkey]OAT88936.1 sugar fermentation stimulation protein SfsA [Candidatus Arthromitus sp. SFB-turkey]HJD00445.1 DNA/RNA nuclease SfsA [Candidatus Dwaynia gallinarum]
MKYANIKEGIFIERVNRFIAHIDVDGKVEVCHVKNTGRCKEILVKGCKVFVQEFDSKIRKTKFDLISVYKGNRLINIDSQVPNKMFSEWVKLGNLFKDIKVFKSEVFYKNSRFDFYVEYEDKKAFIEIKGVTLENEGVVLFPDAPTSRGVKHLKELVSAREEGYEAYVIFIVQMEGVKYFTPNYETHKEFGDTLSFCKNNGVNILAFDSVVLKDEIYIKDSVKVLI